MKKLLVLLFVLAGFVTAAQQTPEATFQASYTIAGVAQEDLYLNAYDWTTTFFANNGNTLVSQKHGENKLEGKVTFVYGKESTNADYVITFKANTCTIAFNQVSNPSEIMTQFLNSLLIRFEGILKSQLSDERKAELKSYQHKK